MQQHKYFISVCLCVCVCVFVPVGLCVCVCVYVWRATALGWMFQGERPSQAALATKLAR